MLVTFGALMWLCGAAAEYAWASQAAATLAVPASGMLDVGGSKIYYERCGAGPAVVLLHDGLVHSVTWDGSWDALCKRFQAIRYDRRGYGRSQAATGRFSQTEDLRALLAHLNVERAIIAGNSSGGALAIDFALAYPGMVKGLLLVGPIVHGMGVTDHFRERGRRNMAPLERGDIAGAAENWSRDIYILAPGHEAARKKLRDVLAGNPQNLKSGGALEIWNSPPAVARLSQIRAPTLILVGESDIPDVHAHCGIIEAGVPGAHREVVKGAGHLIQLDNPDLFTEKLGWFIDRNERKEVSVPVGTLEDYVGRYDLGGYLLTITRADSRLVGHVPGGLDFLLFPESSSKFFLKSEDAEVEFTRDAAGKVNQAIVHEKGAATKAPRL